MGCTVCHEGNGQETDFILASHTPHTHEMAHDWQKEYMPKFGGTDFNSDAAAAAVIDAPKGAMRSARTNHMAPFEGMDKQ